MSSGKRLTSSVLHHAGSQKVSPEGKSGLEWGVSITDACIGWEDTVGVLETLAGAVKKQREAHGLNSQVDGAEKA